MDFFFSTDEFGDNANNIGEDVGAKLLDAIQQILDNKFDGFSDDKRKISNINKGYKIACPYCGDSSHDDSKKRGTIYIEDNSYKCWNGGCGIYRPLGVLLTDFDVTNLTLSEKQSLSVTHIIHNSANRKSLADFYNDKVMFDKSLIIRELRAKGITHSIKGLKYLESRNAHMLDMTDMAYNDYRENLVFLNMFNDKVVGIQIRLGEPLKNGSRFISYTYEDIYKRLLKEENYDVNLAKSLDKVSLSYNILNVDFTKQVNVFESTLDSKYFPNSIALWGSNNEILLPNGYYFFDNDEAGRKVALGYLDKGHYVLLWSKFLKDYPAYSRAKDINDIYQLNPRFNNKILYGYFGSTKWDKMYL